MSFHTAFAILMYRNLPVRTAAVTRQREQNLLTRRRRRAA